MIAFRLHFETQSGGRVLVMGGGEEAIQSGEDVDGLRPTEGLIEHEQSSVANLQSQERERERV